jgi:hypothetical protein
MGRIKDQLREEDLVGTFIDLFGIRTSDCFMVGIYSYQESTHLYHSFPTEAISSAGELYAGET